jgi:sensor histidine kinase YesM
MEKLLTVNFSKNRRKKLFLIHFTVIVGLAMMGYVVRRLFFSDKINPDDQITAGILSVFIISFLWFSINWINQYLNKKLPYRKGITKRIVTQLVIGQIILYSVLTTLMFGLAPRIFKAELTREIIFASYSIYFLINVAANAALIGYHFFIEWKKSILRQERLEKEKSLAHFENLKNQLNPHFLFNSLSSLNSLIYENPDLASKFLKQLSKVYRYVLENNENDPVTLDTEINFVQNYISLLQTRFGKGLEVNINIPPKDRQLRIVPVTLQILVENAIKHNSTFEDNPLIINIYTENGFLTVKNNQQPKTQVEGSHKRGLNNLTSLYHYTTGKDARVHNTPDCFAVDVPLIN